MHSQTEGKVQQFPRYPCPSCTAIPLSRSFSRWGVGCNSWIYIDSSLSPQVHSFFTLGFTLGVLWVWKMYSHVYPSLWCQSTFIVLKILCTPHQLFSLQPLAATHHLSVSMFCLFPECHVVEIVQCVAFCHRLLSLSTNTLHLSFLHVFSWLESSFIFMVK